MTDVRLDDGDGSYLVLEGPVVKVEGHDFMLDASDRRHGGGVFRRALVHDQNDGLTVNYGADYPGGVAILGHVTFPGPVTFSTPFSKLQVAEIDPPGRRLAVHGDITYEVETVALVHGGPRRITVVLEQVLGDLQTKINQLTARVAALEAGPHP
jgi:hypothetical protein